MKSKFLWLAITAIAFSFNTKAQDYPTTPPEVSPMPMKPEMTEIWEPQVPVVTPAEVLGDAPSDAIILFDGSNLDQWVSKTRPYPTCAMENRRQRPYGSSTRFWFYSDKNEIWGLPIAFRIQRPR